MRSGGGKIEENEGCVRKIKRVSVETCTNNQFICVLLLLSGASSKELDKTTRRYPTSWREKLHRVIFVNVHFLLGVHSSKKQTQIRTLTKDGLTLKPVRSERP